MKRDDNFEKLEFWALTTLFFLTLRSMLPSYGSPGIALIWPVVAFGSLMFINFRLTNEIICGQRLVRNISLVVVLALVMLGANVISSLYTYHDLNEINDERVIGGALKETLSVLLGLVGYTILKRVVLYMISRTREIQGFLVIFNRDNLIILGLWMLVTYWLFPIDVPTEVWFSWMTIIPTTVVLHGIAFYWMIPSSLRWKYPLISYFFKVAIFCVVIGFAVAIVLMFLTVDEERSSTMGLFNGLVHFFLTAPTMWLIYRWQMKGKEKISALQNELGVSTANLDFLRSQINPHFLFNALNTIYGLAIQENATRTSESVQRLGDMMRFMLSENIQPRILLARELEYLDNYISLQRLRTDSNSGVRIDVDIQQEIGPIVRIAPMLLIPFVENAFKHGISLREESYIKVSLELKNTTLYFDVHNSRHQRSENDPERGSNGIGLANVKHRLQHMYPKRHELLIRETARDFFVHLQIQLD